MREKLPSYVSFLAAGFDTLDVISQMDVTCQKGNSIEQIEQSISEEFPDNPEYVRGKKFPPGHRIRIQNFVEEVFLKIVKACIL